MNSRPQRLKAAILKGLVWHDFKSRPSRYGSPNGDLTGIR